MRIFNRSTKRFVADARPMRGVLEKATGVMFAPRDFEPRFFDLGAERATNALHSFFCPAFDAVFVNAQKRVVAVQAVSRPRAWIAPAKPFRFVLELPAGQARERGVRAGHVLSW